jgi:hypothetical protein
MRLNGLSHKAAQVIRYCNFGSRTEIRQDMQSDRSKIIRQTRGDTMVRAEIEKWLQATKPENGRRA